MTDTGTWSKDGSTIYRHLDYELQCSARLADNARFVPVLVVCKQVWPTRPRAIAVPRGDHQSAQAAIDAARREGVEWVKNYG